MFNGKMGVAVVLGLLLAACNSTDSDGNGGSGFDALVGKWYLRKHHLVSITKFTYSATPERNTETKKDTTTEHTGTDAYAELKADSTYSSTLTATTQETGKWTLVKDTIVVTPDGGKPVVKFPYTVSGTTLNLSSSLVTVQNMGTIIFESSLTSEFTCSKQ